MRDAALLGARLLLGGYITGIADPVGPSASAEPADVA